MEISEEMMAVLHQLKNDPILSDEETIKIVTGFLRSFIELLNFLLASIDASEKDELIRKAAVFAGIRFSKIFLEEVSETPEVIMHRLSNLVH